jgi:tetratricopeptide (TPR) repeat protein
VTTAAVGEAYFLFMQGRSLEGRGDVPGAIEAYRKAIQLVPQAADVRAELAGLYAREGRAGESVREAEAALTYDAANHEAHRILGLVRAALADNAPAGPEQTTQFARAVTHLEQSLAGGRRDPGTEITLGRLYVRTARYDAAVTTLTNFLLDQPGYPEGVLLLVEALEATGQVAQAVATLEPFVKAEPDLARARAQLAELYEVVGRSADALPHWEELARTNPSNLPLRTRFGTALVNAGRLDDGRKVLLELAGESPRDIGLWYLVAQVENRAGNVAGAENAARMIRDIDASDPRGPLALAEARAAKNDFRGAVTILEPVLDALRGGGDDGAFVRVSLELAEGLGKVGDRDRAVRVLEDARTRAAGDEAVALALGAAYDRAGKTDAAERLYRGLLEARPSEPSVQHALGAHLANRKERLPEALALIRRALDADPQNASYLASLGWAHVQNGEAATGRPLLERAAAATPDDSTVLDHLAEAQFQLKAYKEAAATWDRVLAGAHEGIDVEAVTRKRDRARQLAGRE